jgi:colanic acid biosynthesis glycosyl transferase WcaI
MTTAVLDAARPPAPAANDRTRILFINRSYWPDTEATGQLLTELCEDLAASGEFEPHVLCGQPNHVSIQGQDIDAAAASHHGVVIHRARHSQFAKKSLVGKLLNLLSFTRAARQLADTLPAPDIVVTETDPFFVGLLGRQLKRKTGCRFVAYLQDIYPDVAVACGKAREGWLVRRLRRWLFGAYSEADRVIVLSRDMQERCVRNGIAAERIRVIPNWADVTGVYPIKSKNAFRREHGLEGRFVVMYSGNMGLPHLLAPLIDVAELLQEDVDVVFYFVGGGVQKEPLERLAEARGLSNVRFLPYQPKAALAHSLSAADLQVVSVKPGVISCLMPSKVYGILAAGCPVLAIAPQKSELGQLVTGQRFGAAIDPASPDLVLDLAAAIRALKSDPDPSLPERAYRYVVEHASRTKSVSAMAEVLRSLAPAPRRAEGQGP